MLTWDTVISNSNGVYSGGSPTRLTAITGGWYAVLGSITWNTYAFTTTEWSLKARKNGSTIIGKDLFHSTSAGSFSIFPEQNKVNELAYLNAGDYVELIAETTEPSNRNTIISASEYSPIFSLVLIQTSVIDGGSGVDVVAEDFSASDSAGSTTLVATGASVAFTLTRTSLVQAKAFTTAVSGGGFGVPNARIAINVDGTNYTVQEMVNNAASTGPSLSAGCVFKDIVLGPGLHTVTLMVSKSPGSAFGETAFITNSQLSVVYKV